MFNKNYLIVIVLVLVNIQFATAQVAINTDGSTADTTSALDIKSTTKGLLIPRMTSVQRAAISSPTKGLMVFDITTNTFWYYNGTVWTSISAGTNLSRIQDSNNDTKIQVEETANEDIIRFDIAGTEKWKMVGTRLEPVNSGGSIFIGIGAGENDDLTNNRNVFIGYLAGQQNTTGSYNTANGYQAMFFNTTGNYNTANGYLAMYYNTTGGQNTTNGYRAMYSNTTGNNNTAVGRNALITNTTGIRNTAIGRGADVTTSNLTNATAIGYNAKVASSNSLVLGGTGTDAVNVGIGTTSPSAKLDVVGTFQLTDGTQAANKILTSDANGNASWQAPTIVTKLADTDNDTKIQVEKTADDDIINFTTAGILRWKMDGATLAPANSGTSVFIGEFAGENDVLTNNKNVFIGYKAGQQNTTGYSNTANGYAAMSSNTTGYYNTANGHLAMYYNTTGYYNTANGTKAMYYNTTGSFNTANGNGAMYSNTTGGQNTANGYLAMYSNTTGDNNTAVGRFALSTNTTGGQNTAIGHGADVTTSNLTNATAIGYNAKVASSNSLVLGGTGTNAVNVGIGTTSPSAKLDVVGTFQLTDGTQAANKILTSDANGNASWGYAMVKTTISKDLPSISGGASHLATFTVTNAQIGGSVLISPASALTNGLVISYARVSATNIIEVKYRNTRSAAINLASMNWYITVIN